MPVPFSASFFFFEVGEALIMVNFNSAEHFDILLILIDHR